jgi:signal transduction histidine kinase
MERNNFTEETYFTWSYSPIADDHGKISGVFCAVTEDTRRVLGERRLRTLRDLGERGLVPETAEQACHTAAATLAENPHDLPFVLIYLLDEDGKQARLCETINVAAGTKTNPVVIVIGNEGDDVWDFRGVLEAKRGRIVENLEGRFGRLSAPPWPDDWTKRAVVLPLAKPGAQELPAGFLIAGISPRLAFSDDYRSFFDLIAGHVAATIANARAYEAERKRAEALAELDRAKTAFFSNVSHEFRTPLTLMLGPLEELKREFGRSAGSLSVPRYQQIDLIHRSGLRLLKLVNTLLDFSRIEAGRMQAVYEPTDLAAYTAELASVFRSAVEKAGLKLTVGCPPLSEQAFVDREMWEKIVLNLVSNAFKFTFDGEIAVRVRQTGKHFELVMHDTGIGIPADEVPRVFERFHRVAGAQGRTHEGTGTALRSCKSSRGCTAARCRSKALMARAASSGSLSLSAAATCPPRRSGRRARKLRPRSALGRSLRRRCGGCQKVLATTRTSSRTSVWSKRRYRMANGRASCSPTTMRICATTCVVCSPPAMKPRRHPTAYSHSRPHGRSYLTLCWPT